MLGLTILYVLCLFSSIHRALISGLFQGVKIYDHSAHRQITYIDRPASSPRADLFKCTLHWQDDSTLLIAWADYIKVARVRGRGEGDKVVEITAVFQVDCMIAGVVPHPLPAHLNPPSPHHSRQPSSSSTSNPSPPPLTSLLILAYTPPDTSLLTTESERTEDRIQQKRKAAFRPELRIISRQGEELTADAVGVTDFERWGCNDYALVNPTTGEEGWYVVMSPRDVVLVKPRDARDHVAWLVERRRYEEALEAVEAIGSATPQEAVEIGLRYVEHLVAEGQPFLLSSQFGQN